MLSMVNLAAEPALHWLSAHLCPMISCQAAVAAPLHAEVDWASLQGGASMTLN